MIGVDTNVLLRLFVTDDPAQYRSATEFFDARSRSSPAYIGHVVLVEFAWVLARTYRVPRERIVEAIAALMDKRDIIFENRGIVGDMLERAGQSKADLADLLIASINASAGCLHTVTFDRSAVRLVPGMELLA